MPCRFARTERMSGVFCDGACDEQDLNAAAANVRLWHRSRQKRWSFVLRAGEAGPCSLPCAGLVEHPEPPVHHSGQAHRAMSAVLRRTCDGCHREHCGKGGRLPMLVFCYGSQRRCRRMSFTDWTPAVVRFASFFPERGLSRALRRVLGAFLGRRTPRPGASTQESSKRALP